MLEFVPYPNLRPYIDVQARLQYVVGSEAQYDSHKTIRDLTATKHQYREIRHVGGSPQYAW